MVTTITFWNTIKAENLSIFQADSAIGSPSPYFLDCFLPYDYIGAPWYGNLLSERIIRYLSAPSARYPKIFPVPLEDNTFYGGNGGFSLRSRLSTQTCVELTINRSFNYPKYRTGFPEDVWFSFCIKHLLTNQHLPTRKAQAAFASEQLHRGFNLRPFGIHKIWDNISPVNLKSLIDVCPEAIAAQIRSRNGS